ncbi:MAG TPA: Crp/Fnr family transcriptional regulator [Acidobacteriaceae bacterium]|nr:Crp/Fnr family transcriptional regulator [Acidobacteriaceae bacterium]
MNTPRDSAFPERTWLEHNTLLRHLNQEGLHRFAPLLKPVNLKPQEILYKPTERIEDIYFPDNAVLCMLTIMEDGRSIEAATVGSEGASWISASLGAPTMPCQTMTMIGGRAHKIAARHVEEEIKRNGTFHNVLTEYAHALLIASLRTGACNALHSLSQRSARWMLSTLDRTEYGRFTITQEFLAALLGCTRSTVNLVLAEFEQSGAIKTSRGTIEVVDRAGLEKSVCECYGIIRSTYEELERREARVKDLSERSGT